MLFSFAAPVGLPFSRPWASTGAGCVREARLTVFRTAPSLLPYLGAKLRPGGVAPHGTSLAATAIRPAGPRPDPLTRKGKDG